MEVNNLNLLFKNTSCSFIEDFNKSLLGVFGVLLHISSWLK